MNKYPYSNFNAQAQYHLFVTRQKPNKMLLCVIKSPFNSILRLCSREGVTNMIVRQTNKTLGKSYTKGGGRSNH